MSNTNYNDLIIQFFAIFGDLSIKYYDFAPKYLRNPIGQSANMSHFVAFSISFQNIVTFKGQGTVVYIKRPKIFIGLKCALIKA
jgi:hypothetical protein